MARNRSISPTADPPAGFFPATGSPPAQVPMSKRDKRRTVMVDKLDAMVKSFSDNRTKHYQAQLGAIQDDINLILHAQPYANQPLEDDGSEAHNLITQVTGGEATTSGTAQGDYEAQVGKYYSQFVDAVNDQLEERDYNLTMIVNKHQGSLQELAQSTQYKIRLAQEEHAQLSKTLRERLIQSVGQKRQKLLREKEQLDISDSNALLLHPNQFSIATNPASPGGPQNPRKTRHTRHRTGEQPEDPIATVQENKRKRKAAFEDPDNGSPGPSGRNADLGFASPFRDAKARTMHTQFEASAYSVDRLFTDRELTMAMNTAALATAHFFNRLKNSQENGTNGVNGDHAEGDGEELADAPALEGEGTAEEDNSKEHTSGATPSLAPVDMERTTSHHATRGAVQRGLGDLANAAASFAPAMPLILPANIGSKANAAAPAPSPLSSADVESDLAIMSRNVGPSDPTNERLLTTAVEALRTREFQYQPPSSVMLPSEFANNLRGVPAHLDAGIGGVPMSAQSSMGGYSDAGGVPMSRTGGGSSMGGVGLRRTASGMGLNSLLGVNNRSGRGRP